MARSPRTVGQFADISAVLDTALKLGGARYTLATPGQAVHWKQRAYSLRSLLRKQDERAKASIPGAAITTKYDQIILRTDRDNPCVVLIEILKPLGELQSLTGDHVEPEAETTHDPLLDEALDLIQDNEL